MNINTAAIGSLLLVGALPSISVGELVLFENTNPELQSLKMYNATIDHSVLGQALDIRRSAFDQPELGDLPSSSVFFMEVNGFFGDFIFMGMGRLTMTAKSTQETLIPDTFAGQLVPYFGPENFADGEQINGSSNFTDGFRTMHGLNKLTGETGVFTVEELFTVGITFEQLDGTHYGFAQFERSVRLIDNKLDIQWRPITWGYETAAGIGVNVVPAPAGLGVGMLALLGIGAQRPRRCLTAPKHPIGCHYSPSSAQ